MTIFKSPFVPLGCKKSFWKCSRCTKSDRMANCVYGTGLLPWLAMNKAYSDTARRSKNRNPGQPPEQLATHFEHGFENHRRKLGYSNVHTVSLTAHTKHRRVKMILKPAGAGPGLSHTPTSLKIIINSDIKDCLVTVIGEHHVNLISNSVVPQKKLNCQNFFRGRGLRSLCKYCFNIEKAKCFQLS